MTAPLPASPLLQAIARDHLRQCRAILAGEQQTPEQVALSVWWHGLTREQRRGLMLAAGIAHAAPHRDWQRLPELQRAALVLVSRTLLESLQGVASTLQYVRATALDRLQAEADARKVAA